MHQLSSSQGSQLWSFSIEKCNKPAINVEPDKHGSSRCPSLSFGKCLSFKFERSDRENKKNLVWWCSAPLSRPLRSQNLNKKRRKQHFQIFSQTSFKILLFFVLRLPLALLVWDRKIKITVIFFYFGKTINFTWQVPFQSHAFGNACQQRA